MCRIIEKKYDYTNERRFDLSFCEATTKEITLSRSRVLVLEIWHMPVKNPFEKIKYRKEIWLIVTKTHAVVSYVYYDFRKAKDPDTMVEPKIYRFYIDYTSREHKRLWHRVKHVNSIEEFIQLVREVRSWYLPLINNPEVVMA